VLIHLVQIRFHCKRNIVYFLGTFLIMNILLFSVGFLVILEAIMQNSPFKLALVSQSGPSWTFAGL
jgi:hypothetical protein